MERRPASLEGTSEGPKSFTYLWRIVNYPFIECSVTSDTFSPSNSRDLWYLSLSTLNTNKSISNSCYCVLTLRLKKRGDLSDASLIASFSAELSIGDCKQARALLRQVVSPQDTDSSSELTFAFAGCSDAFAVRHLHDILIVSVEIFYHPTDCELADKQTCPFSRQSLVTDLTDFLKFSLNLVDTDIVLTGNNGSVRSHKFLLISRSDVFRAMFDHDCEEKRSGTIQMPDVAVDVLREFIHFLSSDEVRNMKKYAIDLFVMGDKYNIRKLKRDSESYLSQNVSEETSLKLLDLCHNIRSRVIEKSLFLFYKTCR